MEPVPASPTERSALLPSALVPPPVKDADDHERPRGSSRQLALLMAGATAEFIALTSLGPLLPALLVRLGGVDEADLGFYEGSIEATYSALSMVAVIFWGRMSDRFGRKPVLLTVHVLLAAALLAFSCSGTLWQVILFRLLLGTVSAPGLAVRTMAAEGFASDQQARMLSMVAFAEQMGQFAGPLLGGTLANPAEKHPSVFGRTTFWHNFPYLLSALVISSIIGAEVVLQAAFLRETRRARQPDGDEHSPSRREGMSLRQLLAAPGVARVLFVSTWWFCDSNLFSSIYILFGWTRARLGGWGLDPAGLSYVIAMAGLTQALYLLFVFPPLQRRLGTGGLLRLWSFFGPFAPAALIGISMLLRSQADTTRHGPRFWILAAGVTVLSSGDILIDCAVQLAINAVAPSPAVLGQVNGIRIALWRASRVVMPPIGGSLFALGVKKQILGGYLGWVLVVSVSAVFIAVVHLLPKSSDGPCLRQSEEEDDVLEDLCHQP